MRIHYGRKRREALVKPAVKQVPVFFRVHLLSLRRLGDPLRNDPRFQKLAESAAPKTADK
jgi:hypothetical protein